jgi:hypothetical protein
MLDNALISIIFLQLIKFYISYITNMDKIENKYNKLFIK